MALGAATMIALGLARGIAAAPPAVVGVGRAVRVRSRRLGIGHQHRDVRDHDRDLAAVFALARLPHGARWAVLALGLAAAAVTVVRLNANELLDSFGRDATFTGRTDIWSLVIECISRRPGWATATTRFGCPKAVRRICRRDCSSCCFTPTSACCNSLGLDIGLVGVALFGIAFVAALWQTGLWPSAVATSRAVWPLAALVYFVSGSFTEANIAQYYNRMNWVVFSSSPCSTHTFAGRSRVSSAAATRA